MLCMELFVTGVVSDVVASIVILCITVQQERTG